MVLISFVADGLQAWIDQHGASGSTAVVALLDEDRRAYEAYGMTSGSVLDVWQPKVLWYYAKRMWRGKTLDEANGDTRQLGGDFVVDRQGRLLLRHPSQDPTDRPSLEELHAAAAAAAAEE